MPCPLPGDLPRLGIELVSPVFPTLQAESLSTEVPGRLGNANIFPQSLILLLDFTFCDHSLTPSTTLGVIQETEADGEGLTALGEATA